MIKLEKSLETSGLVTALTTTSSGMIVAGTGNGSVYVLDKDLNVINKTEMSAPVVSISHADKLLVVQDAEGWTAVMTEYGEKLKEVQLEPMHVGYVEALDDSFVACGTKCARFGFEGKKGFQKRWEAGLNETGRPVKHRGMLYIPLTEVGGIAVIKVSSGRLEWIEPLRGVKSLAMCSAFTLVANTGEKLVEYNIARPAHLVKVGEAELPDELKGCKLLDARYDCLLALACEGGLRLYSKDNGAVQDLSDAVKSPSAGAFFGSSLVVGDGEEIKIIYIEPSPLIQNN